MPRVAVFIDYQNLYMQARRSFGALPAAGVVGQVDPSKLGRLLASRIGSGAALDQIRVYRGLPDATRDPRGNTASRAQNDAWRRRDPRVRVLTRPLRYPRGYPRSRPLEKGVDVLLAVDFVQLAAQGRYDIGVLVSQDTDLIPALEAVAGLGGPQCQVAAWAAAGSPRRLRVPGVPVWCHYLSSIDYAAVADPRDYTRP